MEPTRGPARLVKPGRIILRELDAKGWQQKELAAVMQRPEQAISEIINDKKHITAETARELAAAFGTSVDFWLNLEANYRLELAKRQSTEDEIRRRAALYGKLPYGEVLKRGWLQERQSLDEQESDVCRFLDIASMEEMPALAMAARHSAHGAPEQAAQVAWGRRVLQIVAAQSVGAFDAGCLDGLVNELTQYARTPEDAGAVPSLLLEAGIHFTVVPHLAKTYLDGAALRHDHNPVVALTLRYDRVDSFWFTLFHELAHIRLGHDGVFFDSLYDRRELTAAEQAANQLAADWLLDAQAYADFIAKGIFTHNAVRSFAQAQGRHPSVVAGRLKFEGKLDYDKLTTLNERVGAHLAPWVDASGE